MIYRISRIKTLFRSKFTLCYGLQPSTTTNVSLLKLNFVEPRFPQIRYISSTRQFAQQEEKSVNPGKWLLLIIPVAAFGLGTWQVQRRQWKKQLIANMKARTGATPCGLPEDLQELNELEYCPVRVRGEFDHSRELYIGPRTLLLDGDAASQGGTLSNKSGVQSGYLVVTPFKLYDRDLTILVNRGWVPAKNKDPRTRKSGQIEGEVELIGLVRLDEKRAPFVPKNKQEMWFYRDLTKMAEIADSAPVYIEAIADYTVPGGPIGGQTRVTLRDEHLSYLLTWYGLSACTAYMWYRMFIQRKPVL